MLPVQLTVRDFQPSPALETNVRKKVEKLNQYYSRISSCRVVVEFQQKHKHHGKLYNVRIDVTVPGKELVATRKSDEDVYVAIRDAFSAIERQLEEHSRKRHGRVKTHTDVMHGHIARLISNDGYGFIQGVDGNEYYFSVTNVSFPNFEQLCVGDAVEYIAVLQSDGRQAHRVIKERHNNHLPHEISE